VILEGWKTSLPERIKATHLSEWNQGVWFRFGQDDPGIAKIKSVNQAGLCKIVVLWLHRHDYQSISIQVYRCSNDAEDGILELEWIDGYAFGHPTDDEDSITDADGQLNFEAMIDAVDGSLENMEYALVNRRELKDRWQAYEMDAGMSLSAEPWKEER